MRLAGLLASLLLISLLSACGGQGPTEETPAGGTGPEAAPAADRIAGIEAWQRERDERVFNSAISAFTAVASHYIEAGSGCRIGADDEGTKRDPESPMPAMAALWYENGTFFVEAVEGAAAPTVHARDEEGEPEADHEVVQARRKVEDGELIGVGRYFISTSPQSGLGRILIYDPNAPMKEQFEGFRWFPPNPDLRVRARFVPNPEPDEVTLGTSRGLKKTFHRVGTFRFEVEGQEQALVALGLGPAPEIGEELFIPFRDATTGAESYEIGRYLDVEFLGTDREHVLDFNRATNPLCNYSPHYNCPLPPRENVLTVAIRAGEMAYPHH